MTLAIALLACTSNEPDSALDSVPVAGDPEHLFSFVVIADPHITTSTDHQARLAAAVAWINVEAASEPIEMVWVVGDIGWGEGLPISKALLDDLDVPYLPVIGDNEIAVGDQAAFEEVYAPQYELLATTFDGWTRGPVEVYDDVNDRELFLQNFSFGFGGLHWVGLDWCSRDESALYSEFADLHDVDGGTYPYFQDTVLGFDADLDESVLLFSHHPMHLGMFDQDEMAKITGVTTQKGVAANWAGHLHQTAEIDVPEGGYTAYVTDATWDDDNTVRVVQVWSDGLRYSFEQSLVVID